MTLHIHMNVATESSPDFGVLIKAALQLAIKAIPHTVISV
jgi:hypothetical protein